MACVGAGFSPPAPATPLPVPSPLEEASGDSEEGFGTSLEPPSGSYLVNVAAEVDDGDTESCCGDSHGYVGYGVSGTPPSDSGGVGSTEEEGEGDSSDPGGGRHRETAAWLPAGGFGSGPEESSEVVGEAEKSRLFWETCLQSGYP